MAGRTARRSDPRCRRDGLCARHDGACCAGSRACWQPAAWSRSRSKAMRARAWCWAKGCATPMAKAVRASARRRRWPRARSGWNRHRHAPRAACRCPAWSWSQRRREYGGLLPLPAGRVGLTRIPARRSSLKSLAALDEAVATAYFLRRAASASCPHFRLSRPRCCRTASANGSRRADGRRASTSWRCSQKPATIVRRC